MLHCNNATEIYNSKDKLKLCNIETMLHCNSPTEIKKNKEKQIESMQYYNNATLQQCHRDQEKKKYKLKHYNVVTLLHCNSATEIAKKTQ